MEIETLADRDQLGAAAASRAADILRQTLRARGTANVIVATGASQFEMLQHLVKQPDIDWERVTAFHLDEYIGLPIRHPASFRLYLWRRFVSLLPVPLNAFHYVNGEAPDVVVECERLGHLIASHPIDLAMVGIGENGHLAFNDPPADFETETAYLIVELDEACRRQQLGEGWFPTLADVPARAISMSCRQILKSRQIIACVPDQRKADAVVRCLRGAVSPEAPASILQTHPRTTVYLDRASASKLP